jgi:hypothetical protein
MMVLTAEDEDVSQGHGTRGEHPVRFSNSYINLKHDLTDQQRIIQGTLRLSNGLVLAQGTFIKIPFSPTQATQTFGTLRTSSGPSTSSSKQLWWAKGKGYFRFGTSTPELMNFNIGPRACPGLILGPALVTMLLPHILSHYDLRPGTEAGGLNPMLANFCMITPEERFWLTGSMLLQLWGALELGYSGN